MGFLFEETLNRAAGQQELRFDSHNRWPLTSKEQERCAGPEHRGDDYMEWGDINNLEEELNEAGFYH